MKLATLTLSTFVIACACVAGAQTGRARQTRPVFNTQALSAAQADLSNAISSMTSALPIYDGDRVKSIHMAHRALVIIDHELYGAQAQARQKPTVRDHVASKTAHTKYTTQQIVASQAAMNQGIQALNKAASDYQAAVNGITNNKGVANATGLINQSIGEANTAYAIHATK